MFQADASRFFLSSKEVIFFVLGRHKHSHAHVFFGCDVSNEKKLFDVNEPSLLQYTNIILISPIKLI